MNQYFAQERRRIGLFGVTPVEVKEIVYQFVAYLEIGKIFYKSGPEESRHINRWLSQNCFGDYCTRKSLDYKQQEMIAFCFLAAQDGCESQLKCIALCE